MAVVGADEAGRGPVLGSMFIAAVRTPSEAALPAGIDDSKRLTVEQRDQAWAALDEDDRIEVAVAEVPVARIDAPGTDLNTLTVEASARAVGELVRPGDTVVLDASDTDPQRYGRRVAARLDAAVDLRAEHHADANHPVVSAASVAAKAEREAHVARLTDRYGAIGSGYPADPATRAFLRDYVGEHGGLPSCARRCWATSRDVLAAADQSALGEF